MINYECFSDTPIGFFGISYQGKSLFHNKFAERQMDELFTSGITNVSEFLSLKIKNDELFFRSAGCSYGIKLIEKSEKYVFFLLQLDEFEQNISDILDISSFQHEIKNPLTVIDGTAQLLKQKSGSEFHQKCADMILKESERIKGILQNVHMLSELEIIKKKFMIIDLLEDLRDSITMLYPEIQLKFQVMQTLAYIVADKDKLFIALNNIIKNACEAKGTTTVYLQISIDPTIKYVNKKTGKAHPMIKFTIKDNGVGIEQEVMHRIFTPFFTTKNKGSGLGLIITKNIIDKHKGRIEIASNPGTGAQFTIMIPES